MNYLDRHPHARARMLRQFMLESLLTTHVIKPIEVARHFAVVHKCSIPAHTAAQTAKSLARAGVLTKIKQGQYCHSKRELLVTQEELRVLKLLAEVTKPRNVTRMAQFFEVSRVAVYNAVRSLVTMKLLRKTKIEGWPVGYLPTEAGYNLLATIPRLPEVNPFD